MRKLECFTTMAMAIIKKGIWSVKVCMLKNTTILLIYDYPTNDQSSILEPNEEVNRYYDKRGCIF